MRSRKGMIGAVTAASLLSGGLLFVTLDEESQAVAKAQPAAAPAPTVQVIEAISRSLPETASYTGRLAAVEQVDLRPRIGGYIAAVRFREGSIVKRGQTLFEIDARPFEAAASRAKAQLLQAEARRTLAQRKATRARTLRADDVISQAELDAAAAEEADSAAAVEAARALLRAATIDLGDTRVRSPIDGRVGEALVTVGNLVSGGVAAASPLTTIVSVDPLHIEFDIDEPTFRRLSTKRGTPTPVQIVLGDDAVARTATLDFLGNHVDPKTGTARARAVIASRDGELTPGLFARVRIDTGAPRDVVLVRDEVIGTSARGRFVLVVNRDGVVEPRPVQLGETVDGLRAIRSGIAAGERVILKGMARPGMKVTPNVVPMTGGAS
jgi:gold/copper resistance efflux system membrane fusion protein